MTDGKPVPVGFIGDIAEGRRRLGLSAVALWIGYFAIGGNGTPADVEAWLSGAATPTAEDHDLLAQALNDKFTEWGMNHPVRYRRE